MPNLGTVMLNLGTFYRHVWPSLIVLLVTSIMAFFTSKIFHSSYNEIFPQITTLKNVSPLGKV